MSNGHQNASNDNNHVNCNLNPGLEVQGGSAEESIKKDTRNSQLSCSLINARSVGNKIPHILYLILENELDILVITETWLYSSQTALMNAITPEGYTIFSNPRDDRVGGGVAIICRKDFRCEIKGCPSLSKSFEYFQLDMIFNSKTVSIFPVYRPEPNTENMNTFFHEFSSLLETLTIVPHDSLILGDFNIHVDIQDNYNSKKLMEILETFNLNQHVMEPTHESGHILDLIISGENELISNVASGRYFSDHKIIMFNMMISKSKPERKVVKSRNYKTINTNSLRYDIATHFANVHPATSIEALEDLTTLYDNSISDLIQKHAPLKTRTLNMKPKAPWMNVDIMKEKKVKRKLERRWRLTKTADDRVLFKAQKKRYDKLLNEAHTKYVSGLVLDNANDPKSLFKVIGSLLGKKKKNCKLPPHASDKQLADKFNRYFLEKVAVIHGTLANIQLSYSPVIMEELTGYETTLDHFNEVSDDQILKILEKAPRKSSTLDPLPTWLLHELKDELLPSIKHIINSSIALSHVVRSHKTAAITPVLKKANLEPILKNFRPVSNLMYISKLIERVISTQLHQHLLVNNILEPMQSAYRRFHSTETALLMVQNDILNAADQRKVTLLLLLDLSAAFDTVSHAILLKRLHDRVGIRGKALKWLTSYLKDRKQCVSINDQKSELRNVEHGVPQGSVLGPILFLLYTLPLADILKRYHVQYHLYADDTQIYMSFQPDDSSNNEIFHNLEICVCEIKKWMMENLLQINTDKTKLLFFGTQSQLSKVTQSTFNAGGDIVDVTPSARNLGVIFDSGLTMKKHITEVCKTSFYELRNIACIRRFLTMHAAKTVIQALVTTKLDINNSLYYGLPNAQLQRLQRIQNAAARIILRWRKFQHITPGLIELHWLPVSYRIKFKILVMTYKCINNQAPKYLSSLVKPKIQSRFDLRLYHNPHLLEERKSRLVFWGDRSFATAAPKEWNKLPQDIQSSSSLYTFKSTLKTYLFRECFKL